MARVLLTPRFVAIFIDRKRQEKNPDHSKEWSGFFNSVDDNRATVSLNEISIDLVDAERRRSFMHRKDRCRVLS